jgi:3-oxoacyl-[acyl-carrier protein] reductase
MPDRSMLRLAGKVAMVTGGTRGIGAAIAAAYLSEGARVAVIGRTEASISAATSSLGEPGPWLGLAADLRDTDSFARLVQATMQEFGGLDILVNNAGIAGPVDPWKTDRTEWDEVFAVNLRSMFFCSRAASGVMRERAAGGSIVNLASIAGQIGGIAMGPAYAASKAGVIGLTRSLARHFAPLGIRVNCLSPADIDTDMTAAWPEALRRRLASITPLARFGRANEVSGAAVFLASDESSFITGQTLNVNGGAYMS